MISCINIKMNYVRKQIPPKKNSLGIDFICIRFVIMYLFFNLTKYVPVCTYIKDLLYRKMK